MLVCLYKHQASPISSLLLQFRPCSFKIIILPRSQIIKEQTMLVCLYTHQTPPISYRPLQDYSPPSSCTWLELCCNSPNSSFLAPPFLQTPSNPPRFTIGTIIMPVCPHSFIFCLRLHLSKIWIKWQTLPLSFLQAATQYSPPNSATPIVCSCSCSRYSCCSCSRNSSCSCSCNGSCSCGLICGSVSIHQTLLLLVLPSLACQCCAPPLSCCSASKLLTCPLEAPPMICPNILSPPLFILLSQQQTTTNLRIWSANQQFSFFICISHFASQIRHQSFYYHRPGLLARDRKVTVQGC